MPICMKCDQEWTWKQTMKRMLRFNSELICPYCGEKQYQTQRSKTKAALLTPIMLSPLLIQLFFDMSAVALLSLLPVLIVIASLIYPFLVELSCKEEFINFPKDK